LQAQAVRKQALSAKEPSPLTTSPQILVVGTGIIGASIAWHLAAAGARVTVLAADEPGGVATPGSFAWINAGWGNTEPYFRLRKLAMAEWRRLAAEVPGIGPAWCGGLRWDLTAAELEAYCRQHGHWGYDIRAVDRAEAARLEPRLAEPPALAVHVAEEGAVEPRSTAVALLADASRRGARLAPRVAATALMMKRGAIAGIETDSGPWPADEVVVAAGVGSAALAATAGIRLPLTASPGLLVHSRPYPRLLNGLVMAPGLHMRQTAEGRIVGGADFGGSDPGADPGAAARAVLTRARAMLLGADDLVLDFHTVGHRPRPADGLPIVGRADGVAGLWLAVMHSGITLAPAVGRLVTEELLHGRRDPLLMPYGLARLG
jgi:glycine/D-amino acid oxidase-like deaminating enzyme